ncbi:7-cyano-7-deazaguanine synthase [Ruminiclostridium cellulolyticum]|uniref:Asparagine synthetase domain-containing protein n=1 Tax=Ruminiclostridium cellulolyticum (strain ATCC 35319 / DSM 5812 / JCM 6584 / H10) TaxID=394503 RepID=B8I986_RUMCH|nr:asparagine synthase-related protein [Ruminiclostridium cellulolyticum]ACL75346.1 hypothetical protein Ccel_0984 [Ruminiclostridium cellulolyticum H10]
MTTQEKKTNNVYREKILNSVLEKYYNPDSKYDYCVLFSGGKDSTYLANIMKQMKGGRVCTLTVDNGFEDEVFLDHVKKVADKIGVDSYIITPPKEDFELLFNYVIKEPKLRAVDSNAICYFCGQYIMKAGIRFAEENNIPVVIHGMSPTQYNLPDKLENEEVSEQAFIRNIELLEMYRNKNIQDVYKLAKTLYRYNNDPQIKEIMDKTFYQSKKVKMIIPFQYLDYNVENIKSIIEKELDWVNMFGYSNSLYISSGCRMFEIFLLMEKKIPGFRVHEHREFAQDFNKGHVTKKAYDYALDVAKTLQDQEEISPTMHSLIKRIGLEEELL